MVAPPLFSRDGWSYAAQGELTRLGLSPYVWGPGILDGPIIEAVDPRWMMHARAVRTAAAARRRRSPPRCSTTPG